MIKILGRSNSINVRKVLWLCEELDIEYERENWGREFKSPKSTEYLALNPNATIPTIIDNEFVLWQSNSIIRYLANQYNGQRLYSTEAKQRAIIDQWIDWQAIELNNSWMYALMNIIRHSPKHQDPALVQHSIKEWISNMQILENQLAETQAYVTGHNFTLADIPIGLSVQRWYLTPFDKPDYFHVKRYYDLLSERPAYLKWGNNGQN
nr:glutathione S-transferase [Acinetobacter sp. Marseille-Q1620]